MEDPINAIDPDGRQALVGAAIGGAIGLGFDLVLQLVDNGFAWRCVNLGQLAMSGALGAVAGAIGGSNIPPFSKTFFTNSEKGTIGEALSTLENRLKGSTLVGKQRPIPGQTTIADSEWISATGDRYFVESKFGTSGLTGPQKEAARALGDAYHVERWSYDFFGRAGAYATGTLEGIARSMMGSSDCGCRR